MWIKTYSDIYMGVKKEDVWCIWADVNNYIQWHGDLDYCKLDGEFVVGNHFMLKPKGAPALKVNITELVKNKLFVDCTHFPLAKMYDIHEVEDVDGGVRITNTIKVTGLLSFLWVKLVARNVADSIPTENAALVNLARNLNV